MHPRALPSIAFAMVALLALLAPGAPLAQPRLDKTETRIRDHIRRTADEQIALLERVVNIPSGTLNLQGVRQVGDVFRAAFDASRRHGAAMSRSPSRWAATMPPPSRAGG